jgi:hypothetical protein
MPSLTPEQEARLRSIITRLTMLGDFMADIARDAFQGWTKPNTTVDDGLAFWERYATRKEQEHDTP